MAQSFECVECKHVFDKPRDPLLTLGSFILFVVAIGFLFGFFPISIGLFLLIWWMNQNKCPKCKSKRVVSTAKHESATHAKASVVPTTPKGTQSMSGMKKFVLGLSAFLVVSLGLLAILAANTPKPPELTQEQKDAVTAAKEANNAAMDAFVVSSGIYQDSIGTPNLKLVLKNDLEKTVDGIEVKMYFTDNFDEPVGQWSRSTTEAFIAQSQETIEPGATRSAYWNLAVYDRATKITNLKVIRVHFTDGTEITRQ